MTQYQASLTQQNIDALCRTARHAWRTAPRSRRRVSFVWRRKRFVTRHTSFRLIIDEVNGHPVACHWG
jgi:hypothetical protein